MAFVPFRVRRRMDELPKNEGVKEHLRNALQVLSDVKPLEQSPESVAEKLLAAEARLYAALIQLEGRPL